LHSRLLKNRRRNPARLFKDLRFIWHQGFLTTSIGQQESLPPTLKISVKSDFQKSRALKNNI